MMYTLRRKLQISYETIPASAYWKSTVRCPEAFTAAVRAEGWPPVEAVRGKFAFALLESGAAGWKQGGIGALSSLYASLRDDDDDDDADADDDAAARAYNNSTRRPGNLAGRAMFTLTGTPRSDAATTPHIAMLKHDNPRSSPADVAQAVRRGFVVRTRADRVPRDASRGAELARATAARACGAQLVSFDWQPTRKWRALFAPREPSAATAEAPQPIVCNEVALNGIATRRCDVAELEASGPL